MTNKVIQGDCLEVMKTLPENSVDSIVTDPPYELGFMGKSWDKTGIANNVEMWKEALRVLKPGGHLLSFGGTRTYHRMACAIEDAGFEVRDMVSWIYGSGFPKSLNIGKAVDKLQGNEREVIEKGKCGTNAMMGGLSDTTTSDGSYEITKGTSPYEGWGTALKPACEPCVLARKPLSEKTVALNVLKWGTGGINIDGGRVGIEKRENPQAGFIRRGRTDEEVFSCNDKNRPEGDVTVSGRFPANILHDGSDEVLEVFPNTSKGSNKPRNRKVLGSFGMPNDTTPEYADSGSAARFFYCAKTSKSERNKGCDELPEVKSELNSGGIGRECSVEKRLGEDGINAPLMKNNHPTVKPQALMKYLITLITPKGGIVLDPFAGSGSTLVAAKDLGFNYIGIEKEEEYIKIINARLNYER
jgi:site-specific DNA-methyltransferase (adenine-specific)